MNVRNKPYFDDVTSAESLCYTGIKRPKIALFSGSGRKNLAHIKSILC